MPNPQQNSASVQTAPPDGGINLSGLRVRTLQQAKSELPQAELAPPWEEEPRLPDTSPLGQAYGHAKDFLNKWEGKLSEKILAPFRSGLDSMAQDIQQAAESGHTATGGQLSGPTRALADGVGSLLKQVPVGRNVKETVQMSLIPPELGVEGRTLSKELKGAQKTTSVIDLSGLRTRPIQTPSANATETGWLTRAGKFEPLRTGEAHYGRGKTPRTRCQNS